MPLPSNKLARKRFTHNIQAPDFGKNFLEPAQTAITNSKVLIPKEKLKSIKPPPNRSPFDAV